MKETVTIRQGLGTGLLAVALAGIVGAGLWTWQAWRPTQRDREDRPLEGLKIFGAVPDFSLIREDGRRVTLADLRGKVWIANFIYTHCTDTCPLQSARMAGLQDGLKAEADLRLVSITVDPEVDTPEVLSEYASRFGADRERWFFLTGEQRAIYALAEEGFHLRAADPGQSAQPSDKGAPAGAGSTSQGHGAHARTAGWAAGVQFLLEAAIRLVEPVPALAHPGHPGKPFIHSSLFALVDRQARIRGYYPSIDEEALGRLRLDVKALLREK